MSKAFAPAIGIDLGSTKSSVAVFQGGQVEVIPNNLGSKMTPSYVSFTSTGRLIGQAAKNMMAENPSNTVYDLKRLLGRRFQEPVVQSDMNHWPFKVIQHCQNKPKVQVECKGETKSFYPEEITAMILRKMKETAEVYLDKPVTHAVISVPAHFNDAQRRATKDAAQIAGLTVLRILNEPSAAAIAYGFQKNADSRKRNILIYDLGGGTFDVSVLTVHGGDLVVKTTRGDNHLGGEDFDNRMVDHFIKEFKQKFKQDLSISENALIWLRTACEEAKKLLSSASEAPISITSLLNGIDFHSSITRQQFEELNDDLFISSLDLVRKALRDAGMVKSQIHQVILIGGSTRIPKIQEMLKVFFVKEELNMSLNLDEAVVYGAAIQAAILQMRDKSESLKCVSLSDVAAYSLGIGFPGGIMSTLVERNKEIPSGKCESYYSCFDNQESVKLMICEGEKLKVEENKLLATITVNRISPAPKGNRLVYLCFGVKSDGIYHMHKSKETGEGSEMSATYEDTRLSDEEYKRMREDGMRYSLDDANQRELEDRSAFESYCKDVKSRLEETIKKFKEVSELLDSTDHQMSSGEMQSMKNQIERILNENRPVQ